MGVLHSSKCMTATATAWIAISFYSWVFAQGSSSALPEIGWELGVDASGLRVESLVPEGPSAWAGVAIGDRLIAIDEVAVSSRGDVMSLLRRRQGDQPLLVRLGRHDVEILLTIEPTFSNPASGGRFEGVPRDAFRTRGVEGTLVMAGSPLSAAVCSGFFERLSAPMPRVVVVQFGGGDFNATQQDQSTLWEAWSRRPSVRLELIRVDQRDDAGQAAKWSSLSEADGVWILGGTAREVADWLSDTVALEAIHALLLRDGVLGASSEAARALASSICHVHQGLSLDQANSPEIDGNATQEDSVDIENADSPSSSTEQGTSVVIERKGLDLLPDIVLHVGFLAASPENLFAALGESPELVLLHIPPSSGLLARGRRLQGLGAAPIMATWCEAEGWPEARTSITRRREADLTALRRYALRRREPVFPPASPSAPVVESGSLVIVGGGGMPDGLLSRFVELAGGGDAVIAVIPVAMPEPLPPEDGIARALRRAGVREVVELRGRTPEQVLLPANLQVLERATGVWFGGGRQWRFIDAYEGTAAAELMHAVLARGGVIGGSSAGASIQGEYMARGDPRGSEPIMADGYERGLGFLPGVAIDQHFRQRNRFGDMASLMQRYPQLLGIGVDEATALVVQGCMAEVVGRGEVHFFDWRDGRPEADQEYVSLGAGKNYHLVDRSVADQE